MKINQKNWDRLYKMSFASIYSLYVKKVENKGRTKQELDGVIMWLTGHTIKSLEKTIRAETDIKTFFTEVPRINSNASKITGVICGMRVEDIEDPLIQKVRYMDKLVDELAKGKAMEKILRT